MNDVSKVDTSRINGLDEELQKVSQPGDICYSLRSEKEGWLLCNGQAVSRTIYSELFATIGTTYGNGDGSTTFNVPDYRGKFLQMVSSSQEVGEELEAGLPNITGSLINKHRGETVHSATEASGAFTVEQIEDSLVSYSGAGGNANLYFDASRSSSIYGNSTTVQPPAYTVNYFIKC